MTDPTIQPEPQPTPEVDPTRADALAVDPTIPESLPAAIPTQPPAGQPYPGQPAYESPAAPVTGQPFPGQPAYAGQPPYPGTPYPGTPYPGQPFPGQALPDQPFAGQPYPSQTYPGQTYPAQPHPGQAYPGQPYPGQPQPGPGYPGQPFGMPPGGIPQAPPKRKRRTFLIVSLVLVALLVLCAGVGTAAYVVSKKQSGTGQADPKTAVGAFMTAIYAHRDATEAEKYVCAQSDDKNQIASKIKELKTADSTYDSPAYIWSDPTVGKQTAAEATVTTTVTMTTGDEKQSTENLTFTALKNNGWWVCEVTSAK